MLSQHADWFSLCLLALLLGAKHGMDADHLAAIDGLTRYNSRHSPGLARYCGSLFSLGHGLVVLLIAALAGLGSHVWQTPEWFGNLGVMVSVVCLLTLSLVNVRALLTTPKDAMVPTVGIKSRWLARWQQTSNPFAVPLVGALFALSFDTLSQAALFAAVGGNYGGVAHALTLALLFMLGMLLVDGVNGWWIARLLRRADEVARLASRLMSATVAAIGLLVALWSLLRWYSPRLEAWGDGKELAAGLLVLAICLLGFALSLYLGRSSLATQRSSKHTASC